MNPDQDFSLEDYQQYALNTHAFEYHSIKDQQYNKEFWVNIAALVVIVGATLICPPAGIALGAVYGTLEITSAVSGKDWGSGREIDTGERYFRGLLAPLDIIPGVGAAKKFATLTRVNQLHNAVDLGLKTARAGTPLKDTVGNVVDTAKTEGLKRLNQAKQVAVNKLKKDWDDAKLMAKEASDKADEGARGLGKYIFPNQQDDLALAGAGGDIRYIDAENTGKVNVGAAGTAERVVGSGKNLDNVPRLDEIEVTFNRNPKHDSEEFARQLKKQEKGMNELTVDEYLKNRERYIAEGRAIEGNVAQQTAREEAFSDKVAELMSNGKSFDEAEKEAKEWLNTQAALHNPDQIAGGKPDKIGGMGHKGINSSIGSQWRYRIDVVDEQIREMAKNMTPEQLKNNYLNVKLTH